jgi:hypothetical protein
MYSHRQFRTLIALRVFNAYKGKPETQVSFPDFEAPDPTFGMMLFYEDVSRSGGAGGGIQ